MEKDGNYKFYSCTKNDLDRQTATLILSALCGFHGELTSIIKYSRYTLVCEEKDEKEMAKVFSEMAKAETEHLVLLARFVYKLGEEPISYMCRSIERNNSVFDNIKGIFTIEKMIIDAIANEILSIKEYEKIIIRSKNEKAKEIVDSIILDERNHLNKLRELATRYKVKIFSAIDS